MDKKEFKNINKEKDRVFDKFKLFFNDYSTNSTEDNLNGLLDIYQELVPNWVEQFNKLNENIREKNPTGNEVYDDFLRVKLPEGYSVDNLKVPKNEFDNSFKNIMHRGRIIHLSNKIAHYADYAFNSRLRYYLYENMIYPDTPEQFEDIRKCIRNIYRPTVKPIVKRNIQENLIIEYGFKAEDFDNGVLDSYNFRTLIEAYNMGMYIKDEEIESVNKKVIDNDRYDVSYGIKKMDDFNTVFVMDVQKFGQFAVHIKSPDLISQIKRKYNMPLYAMETKMLVDHMSDKAIEFIEDSKNDDSLDEERGISKIDKDSKRQRMRLKEEIKFLNLSKAEKHEIAVKGGLIKNDLEEIDDEERW